ncbi:unnamed protein product [Aureobasidium uvarum]|uniref:F-box domain-containing protein n=1 Tax=Aureobasidium uvarum TaxID=2773716 RepID=A0A9N8KMY4_9PEZI|nr:unnamed protein product [Aureobasidium uvarum]
MVNKTAQHLSGEYVPAGVFPLLSLPVELQTMVFENVVAAPDEQIIMLENAKTPALARVNRYLRKSVLPIFLGVNTFRVFTEEAPLAEGSQAKEAKFRIQNSTMEWLSPLGYQTPLFKSLIVHFGVKNETELVLQYSRKAGSKTGSLTAKHERECRFCYNLGEGFPHLPRALLESMPINLNLRRYIEHAEERNTIVGREHEIALADLEADVFSKTTGLKKDALGISMANIMGIERAMNRGLMTFAMAVHSVNMKRLKDTPCVILFSGNNYVLRRDMGI